MNLFEEHQKVWAPVAKEHTCKIARFAFIWPRLLCPPRTRPGPAVLLGFILPTSQRARNLPVTRLRLLCRTWDFVSSTGASRALEHESAQTRCGDRMPGARACMLVSSGLAAQAGMVPMADRDRRDRDCHVAVPGARWHRAAGESKWAGPGGCTTRN